MIIKTLATNLIRHNNSILKRVLRQIKGNFEKFWEKKRGKKKKKRKKKPRPKNYGHNEGLFNVS